MRGSIIFTFQINDRKHEAKRNIHAKYSRLRFIGGQTDEKKKERAIVCALYLQDIIEEKGGWREFTQGYRKLYHTTLPLYTTTEAYIDNEINTEDIAFLLWSQLCHRALFTGDEARIADPYSGELLSLASQIYTPVRDKFKSV